MDHQDSDDVDEVSDPAATPVDFAVGSRVGVNPGTSDEHWGLIIELETISVTMPAMASISAATILPIRAAGGRSPSMTST
jgi:hypothetical protein